MSVLADVPEDAGQWPGEGVMLAGRYELVEHLAHGGVATLWRAQDGQLDRQVVLKLLLPHVAADETAVARFHREALALAQVGHPNVVRIFDVSEDPAFFVMEYVAGAAFSQFRGHALDAQAVAALGHQVASALGAAHDHGLVHRDVKPANIVFAHTSGRAKLLDFGITKNLRTQDTLTGPQQVVATTRYAAPEQVSGEAVGPWTDVYSLGLLLWEACTGQPAFQGPTEAATALARLEHDPPPVREWADHVPDTLDAIIHRATRRDPHARYAHGRQMADALYELSGPRAHEDTRRLATPPQQTPQAASGIPTRPS